MNSSAVVEHEENVQAVEDERVDLQAFYSRHTPELEFKELFADSLLETSNRERRRRTLTTFVSFILQCLLICILILVPLWFTDVLPTQQLVTFLEAPLPPPPPPPPAASTAVPVKVLKAGSDILNGQLRTPSRIPQKVQMIKEEEAPAPEITGGVAGGVPGGIPGGQIGGVIGGILSSTSSLAAVPKLTKTAPTVLRVRVSQGVTRGMLINRVEPSYPPLARQARVQGTVILKAIIDTDGTIKNLQLVSGHALLAPAAIDAVKQWRYKPYLLNGAPVEVETTVEVTFALTM